MTDGVLSEAEKREIEGKIGYVFRDGELAGRAFLHKSYGKDNNERLEFFGDAVIEFVVSKLLYLDASNGEMTEGQMTEKRQKLVSDDALSKACERADIFGHLRFQGGKKENLGKKAKPSLFEAVVGAICLDGGVSEAEKFVARFLTFSKEENYKGELQEYLQQTHDEPQYSLLQKTGKDNSPTFFVSVTAHGKSAEGRGGQIAEAEQRAAKAWLERYKQETKK